MHKLMLVLTLLFSVLSAALFGAVALATGVVALLIMSAGMAIFSITEVTSQHAAGSVRTTRKSYGELRGGPTRKILTDDELAEKRKEVEAMQAEAELA